MKHLFKRILRLISHQIVCMFAIPILTGVLTFYITGIVQQLHAEIKTTIANHLLTEITGFPLQTILAIVMGYWIGRWLKHVEMLWVWVLPAISLFFAILHGPVFGIAPTSDPGGHLAHFFILHPNPRLRVLDQVLFTLPFFASLAYAVGGWIAMRRKQVS